jgi:hypothetical protein
MLTNQLGLPNINTCCNPVSMFSGCSKITHDVYVVNDAKKVGIVQPGDSAFAAF